MKAVVTISRKWDNPEILTIVDLEGINLQISLSDFVTAIKRELGSITWVVKQDTLNSMLDVAIERVIKGVKEESAKVV